MLSSALGASRRDGVSSPEHSQRDSGMTENDAMHMQMVRMMLLLTQQISIFPCSLVVVSCSAILLKLFLTRRVMYCDSGAPS